MKIAVIGAGISGLSCAYRLVQGGAEVTLYEAGAYFGGHSNTVDVTLDGQTFGVDTGFLVFNDRTYPNLIALFDELGVESAPSDMSFSVKLPLGEQAGARVLEWAGSNLDTVPTEVTLTFDGELDPDGSGFTVTDHHGEEVGSGEVDLDVADRNVLAGTVTIDESGIYTVAWTVLGADGHEISGSFSFGYATDDDIPGGEDAGHGHENPDTALAMGGSSPLTAVGALLIVLAGIVAVRRAAVR